MKITTENLTKRFGDVTAVDDLSITLESGKLVALLGPSGCGKSTILNMLSGVVPVTGGKIFFNDKDVTSWSPDRRGVGLVFQNYALYPHMTVLGNICFPLEIKKVPKAERLARAGKLAEMVHISELLKRKPSELSGGQQQRVAIARALAKEPDLLLLDEPLSNLDAKLRVEMREEIRRIQRQSKVTTVFVTHDQEEASSIADEVVLLRDGRLQQQNSAQALYNDPVNLFVADFLGSPPINKLSGTMRDGRFFMDGGETSIEMPLRKTPPEGSKLVLASRAETICLEGKQPVRVTIRELYTLGKDELAVLDICGQLMRGYMSSELGLKEGDRIDVSFREKGLFLFDAETGERYA